MRPCPACDRMQPDLAAKCSDCGAPLPPPTGAVPVDPLVELRAALKRREEEVADATAQIAAVKREAGARESELRQRADALSAENEQLRARLAAAAGPAAPAAWGSAALIGLLRKWPRAATAAATVMTLGTAYGGWDVARSFRQDRTEPQTAGQPAGGEAADAQIKQRDELRRQLTDVVTERDRLREQTTAATRERDQLREQSNAAGRERDELKTRVSGLENQLGVANKSLTAATTARDEAFAREKAATGREKPAGAAPSPKAFPSAGYVDFVVPQVPRNSEITLQRGRPLLLPGGSWPSGECTIVAGDPEARFDNVAPERVGNKRRTAAIPGTCNAAVIVVKKSQDWHDGDVVRLLWQTK
jgi:hypothetical protein